MDKPRKIVYVNTVSEQALEEGAGKVAAMLTELGDYLVRRSERTCLICSELEWMDPGEQICWKCGRCHEVLVMLSHPLTQSSSPEHRALREVIDWMEAVPEGQERSSQEIQSHLEDLRVSYTWSPEGQYTAQDSYQDWVSNLLLHASQDMDIFFRRLPIVRSYYHLDAGDKKGAR